MNPQFPPLYEREPQARLEFSHAKEVRLGVWGGADGYVLSLVVNSPRPIQNLAFSWGGLPGKVAPTCV